MSADDTSTERMDRVTIAISHSVVERIREQAVRRDTPLTTLLRLWIVERLLDEEERDKGGRP